MKTANFKLFSLLPHKKVRPVNIKINNTVLAGLHKNLKNGVQLEGRDLWEYYFNTKLIKMSERRTFEDFMETDGMSASLSVSRPKEKKEVPTQQTELLQSATRVVAVDPGRNPIFTAVVHNEAAMNSHQSPGHEIVKHDLSSGSGGPQTHRKALN